MTVPTLVWFTYKDHLRSQQLGFQQQSENLTVHYLVLNVIAPHLICAIYRDLEGNSYGGDFPDTPYRSLDEAKQGCQDHLTAWGEKLHAEHPQELVELQPLLS